MFYHILDKRRLAIIPKFKNFKKDFYLAGGTALALQIGHRDSIDFDFFAGKNIDTKRLFAEIKKTFKKAKILKVQEEDNTLTVILDEKIKLSFFTYKYKLIKKLIHTENLNLASIEDIACMKLSAITHRAVSKDYIDLYFILQKIKLEKLLEYANKKFPDIDQNLILKSLVYFDDIQSEPIKFRNNSRISLAKIKKYLIQQVRRAV